LTVRTTALVIVVSGLKVRDVELRDPDVFDGGEVIDDTDEDVERGCELDEVLQGEVVEGGVVEDVVEGNVVDGGNEVEGGSVEGGWSVDVFGDSLVKVGRGCLSTQISERTLSDGSTARTRSFVGQTRAQGIHLHCPNRLEGRLEIA
jgi:hypothetical protein